MDLDFLGAELNLSVLEGADAAFTLAFRSADGAPLDVSDVTFDGVLSGPDGAQSVFAVEHAAALNELRVYFGRAPRPGRYAYEVRATAPDGARRRLVHGQLGVLSTALELARGEEAADGRVLQVCLPDEAARHVLLEWRASSAAVAAAGAAAAWAAQVQGEAERVQAVADDAAQLLSETTGSLEGLRGRAEAAMQAAEGAVQQVQGFLAIVDGRLASAVIVDPATGHLVIGGVDTQVKVPGDPGMSPYVDKSDGRWRYYDDVSQQWLVGPSAQGEAGRSPYISSLGTWVEWDAVLGRWRDTGLPAQGKDGLDGAAVRRILVASVEEIPQEGETCHGGVYYYVRRVDAAPRARVVLPEAVAAGSVVLVEGAAFALAAGSGEAAAAALAQAVNAAGDVVQAVAVGAAVELFSPDAVLSVDASGAQGVAVEESPRCVRSGYDVYAWLEEPGGGAGWACVGEAYDVASREVYGLVRLGTDAPVADGAPVGVDAEGRMSVPRAEYTVPGAVLPGVDFVLESGGGVGFDAEGRLFCRMATVDLLGAVKPSFSGSNLAAVVGIMADGSLGIPWGSWTQAGVFRAGSQFGQSNPIPFIQGVGVTQSHELANNLLYSGAVRHMNPAGWAAVGMAWLPEVMEGHPEYFSDMFYTGLVHSPQFTQSMAQGLELVSATGDLLAGVYLALSMGDDRVNAAPCARVVYDWVTGYAYSKDEVYTKEEARSWVLEVALEPYWTAQEVRDWVQGTALVPYESTASLLARGYDTVASVDKKVEACMKRSGSVSTVMVVAPGDLPEPARQAPGVLYLTWGAQS